MQSHEDVITKANRLLTGLRTSPAAILGQRSRSKKKRRRPSFVEKELNKNLVLIEFLGHSPPEVQVLHDYYKLYEGSLSFTMSMTEAEIRKKIASHIREKKSLFNDYEAIGDNDFAFVRCINRKIRVPDGEMTFDANGIRRVYHSGAIYVQLTKSFSKKEVNSYILWLVDVYCYSFDFRRVVTLQFLLYLVQIFLIHTSKLLMLVQDF